MNTRRKFLTAGGAVATLSALPSEAEADPQGSSVYVTGMVWNRQLAAPMNDWLIRVYAAADLPTKGGIGSSPIGFAKSCFAIDDVESHLGVRKQAELVPDLLRNGDLALARDPHGQSLTTDGKNVPRAGIATRPTLTPPSDPPARAPSGRTGSQRSARDRAPAIATSAASEAETRKPAKARGRAERPQAEKL